MQFPRNEIISLLDERLDYNIAESTNKDLILKEIMTEDFIDELKSLKLEYGTSQGNPQLRSLVSKKIGTLPENILLTNGAISGIFLSILCLCELGDEVVSVQPNFPPTVDLIEGLGFKKKILQLKFDTKYQLCINDLLKIVTPRTRLIILVSPLNPSGTNIDDRLVKTLIERSEDLPSNCKVLIDETYREAVYGSNKPADSFAGFSDKIITVSSLSKCHGAPGLRLGWLSSSDQDFITQATVAKLNTVISNSVLDEFVAIKVLEKEEELFCYRREHSRKGLEITQEWVERNNKFVEWIRPDAGALCCIRLRKEKFNNESVAEFYRAAKDSNIQLAHGNWFGEDKRIFRLGFGYMDSEDLIIALVKLEEILLKLAANKAFHTDAHS